MRQRVAIWTTKSRSDRVAQYPAATIASHRWPPERIVRAFLAVHVLIWWLLPALLQHNLPLDVIELLAWGREWQIVYYKHPPLPAWILEVDRDRVRPLAARAVPGGTVGLGAVAVRRVAARSAR